MVWVFITDVNEKGGVLSCLMWHLGLGVTFFGYTAGFKKRRQNLHHKREWTAKFYVLYGYVLYIFFIIFSFGSMIRISVAYKGGLYLPTPIIV